jgi:hypothetical protein
MVTTDATPIMIPRAVRLDRIAFRRSARIEIHAVTSDRAKKTANGEMNFIAQLNFASRSSLSMRAISNAACRLVSLS